MKIAYLSDSTLPGRSANSIHVMNMCAALANLGHDVTLFAYACDDLKEQIKLHDYYGVAANFTVKAFQPLPGKLRIFGHSWRSVRGAKAMKAELVYGRSLCGCFLADLSGFPIIYESHGLDWRSSLLHKFYLMRLAKSLNLKRFVVISDALKRLYADNLPSIPQDKIVVAHDAAPESVGMNSGINSIDLGGRSTAFKAGYFGHLYPGRGVDVILKVALILKDIDFHIIGGTESDIDRWKETSELTNVYFHGFVSPGEVSRYRAACDVLLAPYQRRVSVSGGAGNTAEFMSPLKVFEYMSSRKPIICSDIPVLREALNQSNAVLVPCDNVQAWVSALRNLSTSSEHCRLLSENSYNDFLRNYTWKTRAERAIKSIVIN